MCGKHLTYHQEGIKKKIVIPTTEVTKTDILIIGGGASGISAGTQAARMGAKTIIIEETPWVGGMLTSAGVTCIDGNYKLRSGIFGEFSDSLAVRYGGWDALKTGWVSHINYEPHIAQEILSNIASSCKDNLEIRRETKLIDVKKSANKWIAKIVDTNGRKTLIESDILIDATELGDVAKKCGAKYKIGMEASSETGESIAPKSGNNIIQDLTYVAILKDYGPDADMTIDKPEGYDPSVFANSCINNLTTVSETGQTIWPAGQMITYGKLPNGKYMINWPIYGNDYYLNSIEMGPEARKIAYQKAKHFTLCFIYFIQTELGMNNLGIADDEFPTEDNLPLIPYHRESRRINGEAFFTIDAASKPYEYHLPYYRTGIAVGDYAVDHHHFRHPEWKKLPDLEFYPIPSFSVPAGSLLPKDIDNLIVTEKSISVSNLMNGATRLQPVVMQLGQAAGALGALAIKTSTDVKSISIRDLQQSLLDSGCYLMPYLDLPVNNKHFMSIQRIGASGLMRGIGKNVGWSNETWFRTNDPLLAEEIFITELCPDVKLPQTTGEMKIGTLMNFISNLIQIEKSHAEIWESLGLNDFDINRTATRIEGAVVMDSLLRPFESFEVDYDGKIR